jgi:retron-type reverse transcriptase
MCIWQRKGFGPPKFIIEFDAKKCFDTIFHKSILENVASVRFEGTRVRGWTSFLLTSWISG